MPCRSPAQTGLGGAHTVHTLGMLVGVNARFLALFAAPVALLLGGCSSTERAHTSVQAQQQAILETNREQMEMVPPPSKNRFMAVRSLDRWENPYVIVQAGMLELHVTMADANPSNFGAGGMLRPAGARRQELNISLAQMSEAVAAIPQGAWPYGRVVAITEATKTPANVLPTVRRNMELAIGTLNELGVVAYDPADGTVR